MVAGPSKADRRAVAVTWVRRLAAEAIGTFALVFVAAGGDTAARLSDGMVDPTARAIAPALVVAALIYAVSDQSGAHFNPAVSLAFALRRELPASWLGPYWAAQAGGAVAAAWVLAALFGDAAAAGVSRPHIPAATALVTEAILTTLLVTVILGTADRARIVGPNAALAVGATIAACGLVALPIEGASMNPARSLGPAVVSGDIGDLWIYIAGPVLGACLAVAGVGLLRGGRDPDPRTSEAAMGDSGRGQA
jgi:aquaporin Z